MNRTRFVDDLTPGDRVVVDGVRGVVRKTVRQSDDQHLVELIQGPDELREVLIASGARVEVL